MKTVLLYMAVTFPLIALFLLKVGAEAERRTEERIAARLNEYFAGLITIPDAQASLPRLREYLFSTSLQHKPEATESAAETKLRLSGYERVSLGNAPPFGTSAWIRKDRHVVRVLFSNGDSLLIGTDA